MRPPAPHYPWGAVRHRTAAWPAAPRPLWSALDLTIEAGQFVAVLGANGAGKTSLLKVLLGEQQLSSGSVRIDGQPVTRGGDVVGYVPQRVGIDSGTMVKARDVVPIGIDDITGASDCLSVPDGGRPGARWTR